MTPEQLEAIEGIGPKTVEKISMAVNNYFSSLEGGELAATEGEATVEVPEGQEASIEPDEAATSEVAGEDVAGDETAEIALPVEPAESASAEHTHEPAEEEPAASEGKE